MPDGGGRCPVNVIGERGIKMTSKVIATAAVAAGLLGGTAGATAASAGSRPATSGRHRTTDDWHALTMREQQTSSGGVSAATSSARRLPVLYAGPHYGGGKIRPHGLSELLFQDGQFYLTTARWKRWTDKSALSRTGKECSRDAKAFKWTYKPGTQTDYQVRVHHGQRYFSRFRFTYKAKGVRYTIKGHYATTAGGWWD